MMSARSTPVKEASVLKLGPRRGIYVNIADELDGRGSHVSDGDLAELEFLDAQYRALCAMLYNYVPGSGHPGGSISSGRFVEAVLYDAMDYDIGNPDAPDADVVSYAAGHKALGLYAMWALRNEVVRIAQPDLLPADERFQLRFEDLLGFRRNPVNDTPLFRQLGARALDGHPTPATPFVRLATGASGVGLASSCGLALGAMDLYRRDPPRVHVIEGEGGMTPGRVAEAFAAAGTMGLRNLVVHVDWNQASIDSNRVCRDGRDAGEYVQWNPVEFAYLHDWNAILVPDGTDFRQIVAAQRRALGMVNHQPTAIVYRTTKGWQYGIEGRASHGAGHKLCAAGFYEALRPLVGDRLTDVPACEGDEQHCRGCDAAVIERCYWEALSVIRETLAANRPLVDRLAGRLAASRSRLADRARRAHRGAPALEAVLEGSGGGTTPPAVPEALALTPGQQTTLRGALGDVLGHLNRASGGGLFVAAADLVGSTSVNNAVRGFADGYFHAQENPDSRLLAVGGICEDAAAGLMSGLSAYGRHIGVVSSYAAFLAPLGHIAARLHAIGGQARRALAPGEPYKPFILVCAHAGLKTGEDGPTHADPQAYQLLSENFPLGTFITLTPWDAQEMWPLVTAALARRPAVVAPFVTRPAETVIDRRARGLAPASAAVTGVYVLKAADPARPRDGVIALQESGVTYAFVEETLPVIEREGFNLHVVYVASAELFDLLPAAERERIFPDALAREAMGITGFTLPTLYRWVTSQEGRAASLHPFARGHFLGSGQAHAVLREAGLDGAGQFEAIRTYVHARRAVARPPARPLRSSPA
jgi:transketolase